VRRLLLIVLSGAILLSACATPKSFPGSETKAPSRAPATPTLAPTEAPTPTEAATPTDTPTDAPTDTPTAAPPSDWTTFAPSGSGFSVLMPGKPDLTKKTFNFAAGNAPGSLWSYGISNDLALFLVQANFTKGAISGKAPSALLDAEVAKLVSNTAGSSLVSKADITLNGHPGKTFTVDQPDLSIMGGIFVVQDEILIAYVGYTAANTDTADINSFLGSFEITI
jgi:hypothetical protein